MKVVQIKSTVNGSAIEVLEETIERVKSGEITEVGIAFVTKEGSLGGRFSSGDKQITMWAALMHATKEFYRLTFGDEV